MGNAEFSLKGYQMFRKDREVRRGGGVALYIKQSIQAYEFQINNVVDYDEAIWCNILIRGAKLTVGVVYRCPSTSKEQDVILHNVISHVSRNDCVIMGDFNHADIRWNSLDSCDDGKAFLILVQDCFLTQHVSEPTRGDNILDLILSTQKEMIDNVRVVEPLGKSDHSQIQFNLRVKTVNKGTKQKRRDFQKGDYDGMRQYAHNKKWKLNILKFADDTKMFRRVESQEDRHQLQSDLNKLVKWAEKWQMLFNKDKCKCLHIGQANAKNNYLMNNTVLLSTEREKDVGVVVSSDMKVSEQCGIAARKGNQILGLIRRNIAYRDKRLIIPLYMSLVRPHLEYCIQAWRPHMRKDIDKLERVQRRATRLISEISQLSYEERLQQCRLTTLETRRIRGDQIEVFKIMHGYEGLNKDMFFRLKNDSITRGHSLALVKSHSRLDIRKYTFSQRVVNDWNKLPEECINATSVNMFKNKIDQYYLKTRRE